MKQISSLLEDIIDINRKASTMVKQLCTQAAKMWLNFEIRRCRNVLRPDSYRISGAFSQYGPDGGSVAQVNDLVDTWKVRYNELSRYGTMNYPDLDTFYGQWQIRRSPL